ncbi:helix-turn-helix domain-containing protein [Flavihumibacter sediminis]|nr:helix-turn-helix domain-containing protein [Flavihumibacter sediminis]
MTESMLNLNNTIRQLYKPIQPTVKQSAEDVSYIEMLPALELQNVIYCYWQLKSTRPLSSPFTYRVVADGCIDIFFDLNSPADNFVMGFCKKFTEFPLHHSFNYIGVRFLPTMFPQLFKVDASELSNRFEELQMVVPATSHFIASHFNASQNIGEAKKILDTYFTEVLQKSKFDNDPRLYEAIEIILIRAGVLDIEKDINTGISYRQLRRLFEFYIGDTPKTFSKVIRFQNILKAKPSKQSLQQNKLFFDVGYYDQAHFIKEFRNFYGVTPGKAFGR